MQISKLLSAKKIFLIRTRTCHLLCLGLVLTASLVLLKNFLHPAVTYIRSEGLRRIEISSSEYPYFSYSVDKPRSVVSKKSRLFYKTASPQVDMAAYDYYAFTFLYEDSGQMLLYYSPTLNEVYDNSFLLKPSPDLKEMLLDLTAMYRQEIFRNYGALLVWEEVNKVFPMYATARITDIYSRASFNVQRREGCSHVDAQPLTAEDTAIMKIIYGGRWSWERKGIIVEVGGYRIAASMNGMPHGAGKIDDNNFPGHFCIHFFGSTIHSGGMDIQHHREILKAAGKLPLGYYESGTPEDSQTGCTHF